MTEEEARGAPWILYDEECGICREGVSLLEGLLVRRGFHTAPLQEVPWVAGRLGVEKEKLLEDIRLLLEDGSLLAGADAYRYAMKRIWWAYPLYLFSIIPGARRLFDQSYRLFAAHRHHLSRACGLPDASEKKKGSRMRRRGG